MSIIPAAVAATIPARISHVIEDEDGDDGQEEGETQEGQAKRTALSEFRRQTRNGLGMIGTGASKKTKGANQQIDSLAAIGIVNKNDEVLVGSANGLITRVSTNSVQTALTVPFVLVEDMAK
eukprot:gene31641-6836_t